MKRKLIIEIDCGDEHCHDEGKQCRNIAACDIGNSEQRRCVCILFSDGQGSLCELLDKDGRARGELRRCKPCLDAESAAREDGMKCKT